MKYRSQNIDHMCGLLTPNTDKLSRRSQFTSITKSIVFESKKFRKLQTGKPPFDMSIICLVYNWILFLKRSLYAIRGEYPFPSKIMTFDIEFEIIKSRFKMFYVLRALFGIEQWTVRRIPISELKSHKRHSLFLLVEFFTHSLFFVRSFTG